MQAYAPNNKLNVKCSFIGIITIIIHISVHRRCRVWFWWFCHHGPSIWWRPTEWSWLLLMVWFRSVLPTCNCRYYLISVADYNNKFISCSLTCVCLVDKSWFKKILYLCWRTPKLGYRLKVLLIPQYDQDKILGPIEQISDLELAASS